MFLCYNQPCNKPQSCDTMKNTPPLYAAILIGGKSRRMGRPKHLICTDSTTWLERTVALLESVCDNIVIIGAGELPPACTALPRVPDIEETDGPLAGVLAAMRFAPEADWLVFACDMPAITAESVLWLVQEGKEGTSWGVVPRLDAAQKFYEPLFALYKSPARTLFETLLQQGKTKIGLVADNPQIQTPLVPPALHRAWENINTPGELNSFLVEQENG